MPLRMVDDKLTLVCVNNSTHTMVRLHWVFLPRTVPRASRLHGVVAETQSEGYVLAPYQCCTCGYTELYDGNITEPETWPARQEKNI
jgi:hypothetical protein